VSAAVTSTTPLAAPSGTSYVQRQINLVIKLGLGSFGQSGFNTVTLTGLRVQATMKRMGFPGFSDATIRVYGLTTDLMNQISTLGKPRPMDRLNTLQLIAGDATTGLTQIFQGIIQEAWQEFGGAPDTFMTISCLSSTDVAMAPVAPTTFNGSADVATLISSLAGRANPPRGFVNNGVTAKIAYPYHSGTILQQAQDIAAAARIEFFDDGATFWIWPRLGVRVAANPLISPASGLIGYPSYTATGLKFRCLFNPSIQFAGYVTIAGSSVGGANGVWHVRGLVYELAAQMPNGPWFCDVDCDQFPGIPGS